MNFENHKMVSVIVPCFNSGKTLRKTINSIKNQSWNEKEVILVNDGSNDEKTLEILNSFKNDSLIKIIKVYQQQEMKVLSLQKEIIYSF